jgi:single-strand DNA-binding protein
MNTVCLLGRTTRDLELKTTPGGKTVCSFTLAVHRPNTKDTADFVDCVAGEKTAETLSTYMKKGNQIWVSGYVSTRNFEDKNGQKRKMTDVVIQYWGFAEAKAAGSGTGTPEQAGQMPYIPEAYQNGAGNPPPQFGGQPAPQFEPIGADDDELPF